MGTLKNELTWSRSRDGMFQSCRRRYWFNYYGSWGGWERGADERTRLLYRLKKLKTRAMWAGTVVHDTLEQALVRIRDGEPVSEEAAWRVALGQLRDDYRRGKAGHFTGRKGTTDLFELYYGEDVDDADWMATSEHVRACLATFFASPWPEELRALPREAWLSVEDMTSFDFEGTKIWVVPDLAYRRADGDVCIVDWKTGAFHDEPDPVQLACYALYATGAWGATPEAVVTVEYNLREGKRHERRVDAGRLDEVRSAMRESIAAMRAVLRDVARNVADEEAFPMTDEVESCGLCPFKQPCRGAAPNGR